MAVVGAILLATHENQGTEFGTLMLAAVGVMAVALVVILVLLRREGRSRRRRLAEESPAGEERTASETE